MLELRHQGDGVSPCYFTMASALGLPYSYQTCASPEPEEPPHTANLRVDIAKLTHESRAAARQRMSVSVVIPVRDEAGTIGHTLDDLLAQSRRPDEVVFVDAGSRDGTPVAIAAHALARTLPVRVVQAGAAYPGRARNLGVAASEGDWVAFTDAGVRLAPSWLETLAGAAAADPGADAIAGDWDLDVTSPFERCLALLSAPTEGLTDGRPSSTGGRLAAAAAYAHGTASGHSARICDRLKTGSF